MNFLNKTVLITGGSRGIGRATAQAFAERGAKVAINFRSDSQAAKDTINSLPGEGHFAAKADISNPSSVEKLVDAVTNEFGSLDIVINNAGVYIAHPIDNTDFKNWGKAWHDTLSVNLTGAANVCYCAAQQMMKQGSGRIVNISSRGAFRGEPDHPAYGASKAGLNAMSQSLAKKLAPYNIYVTTVAPGFVETDMAREFLDGPEGEAIKIQSPLNRAATPEEIAKAILWMSSEGCEYVTGAILDVNGASYLRS
ncbi:MAG: SDR family oxidoreductase [Bacteroidetes bacterium]|jgi:NAD(P)-dependent dehydrogenase (short-subunit alcohol dehydrogenase family)|nr:SDR family oxidoreductase [Bacteroidota bacterium]MDF1864487.1 SDR family NAD(P)-dependent oxidoreductase [Saprospiraceae bacterium]